MPNPKSEMRERLLTWRRALPASEVAARSAQVAWPVLAWCANLPPGLVAGYVELGGEVDPAPILDVLRASGWEVALPKTAGPHLSFHRHRPGAALRAGQGGVMEPVAAAKAAPGEVSLAIVPGVAFDRQGGRLGRGGGHYDRWLAAFRGPALGLCYEEQVVAAVPLGSHDRRVSHLATEEGVAECRPS